MESSLSQKGAEGGDDVSRNGRLRKIKHMELSPIEIEEPKKKKKKIVKAPFTSPNISTSQSIDNTTGPYTTSSNKKFNFDTPYAHHTLHTLNSSFFSGKRPRGRPPLSGKKPSIAPAYLSGANVYEVEPVPATTSAKAPPRPPYKIVTKKLFSKIIGCDPLSIDDICKRLPECPKDMISATLDVLQIIGLVIQREITDTMNGKYSIGTMVYSPANFSKLPWPLVIDKLDEEMTKRSEESQRVQARLDAIYVRRFVFMNN